MKISSGKIQGAQRIILYGPEGIGKSTLANQFPSPVFIDTEGGTNWMNVDRLICASWRDVLDSIKFLKTEKHTFKTVVFDTADWAERLCTQYICSSANKLGLSSFDHGKGYLLLDEEFGRMLASLNNLIGSGMHIIFVAHAAVKSMTLPDESGSFDHWELKCSKRISPLLKEWAEAVLFVNYKITVTENEVGKTKAIGGRKRIIHTQHTAAYDAKNRSDLPDQIPFELPFDFKLIEKILGEPVVTPKMKEQIKALPFGENFESAMLPDKLAIALEGITGDANDWLIDKSWVKPGQTFRDLPEVKMKEILDRLQNFKVVIKKHKKEKANVK